MTDRVLRGGTADEGSPDKHLDAPGKSTRGRLVISEVFGPTVQGEGVSLGRPAIFVRTAGCPLSCLWCDTPYSWDWSRFDRSAQTRKATPGQIWQEVRRLAEGSGTRTLVLTGGEPATQASGLVEVALAAKSAGWWVEMETSGAVDPGPLVGVLDLITVSPKTSGSGMETRRRINPAVLAALAVRDDVVFKFVIDTDDDLAEADQIVAEHRPSRVFVMAQATNAADVARRTAELAPAATRRGWTITPRLHILLWGDERGR